MNDASNPGEIINADVIIIGAGVVGGMAAWALSKQGLNVAMLDAGALVDRVDAVERFKKSPGKNANAPYLTMPWAPVPSPDDPFDYYVQPGHDSKDPRKQIAFNGYFMRLVGGTSWHWTGHAERMFPGDFKTRSLYGHGVDWPLAYDDMQPYYNRVEYAWGVAGDAFCLAPPRDVPYPMPVVPRSYLDRQVGKATKKVLGVDTQPLPHCRNSIPGYDGRPQCCGNSSCLPICPIAAKYDGHVHVDKAVALGARVMPNRVAYQVEQDADGKILGVWYNNYDNGANGMVGVARGQVYILAAHAVQTALLMLQSGGKMGVPAAGLSNSSDQVGRNLMGFANINTLSYAPADAPVYPYRGPVSATGTFGHFRDGEFRKDMASMALFSINAAFEFSVGPLDEAQAAIEDGLLGSALRDRVRDRTARQVNIHGTIEVMSDPDNRVTLSELTDAYGQPRPKVNFRLDEYTLKGCRYAWDTQIAVMKQMGCSYLDKPLITTDDENWNKLLAGELDKKYNSITSGDAVIAGTARMGDDWKTAVVDKWSRSFDNPNLYVVGTSNYCTTGSASPSLTAAALALRAADHIVANFNWG